MKLSDYKYGDDKKRQGTLLDRAIMLHNKNVHSVCCVHKLISVISGGFSCLF